jgi:hypothetical protein
MFHYVYRITNIKNNKHYYGKRSSKVTPFEDLGKKYFSSCKDKLFINEQKKFPQNFKYKVIRCFNSSTSAINFEIKLHNKFQVDISPHFYNRAKQTSNKFQTSYVSIDTRKKLSDATRKTNIGAITSKKRAESNRKNGDVKWQKYIEIVNASTIDFTKYGWAKLLADLLGISHQQSSKWLKRHCPEIYSTCFKRKNGPA